MLQQRRDDAPGGVAVAVRVNGTGHGGMGGGVIQEALRLGQDAPGVGADEAGGAGFHGLRPLGDFPQDEDGHAQAGRFLLDAS